MVTDYKLAAALAFHGKVLTVPKSAVVVDVGEEADGIVLAISEELADLRRKATMLNGRLKSNLSEEPHSGRLSA